MSINTVENFTSSDLQGSYDIIDISGQGFYKQKIIDSIPSAKAIIVFVDSTEKY